MNGKTKLQLAALILFCVFCSAFVLGKIHNKPAPSPELHDLAGNAIELSSLQGKWVVINYWAPWCAICLREVPELNKFYHNNRDPNIVFFGVDYDHPAPNALAEAVEKMGIHFPVLQEEPSLIWHFQLQDSIPVTFIINPQGQPVKIIYGTNTEQSLLDTVHELQK